MTEASGSAEAIARVVADLRAVTPAEVAMGADNPRVRNALDDDTLAFGLAIATACIPGPVVDCTAIYESVVDRDEVMIYEDHPSIAPPFDRADFAYVNRHGNVHVMTMLATQVGAWASPGEDADVAAWTTETFREADAPQSAPWRPANPVDWDRVRWIIDTYLWVGGRSNTENRAMKTMGPVHLWRFAVYDDDAPADLHWVQLLPDVSRGIWDCAHLVLLGSLNYLQCRNVEIVEPARSRPVRRRMAREAPGVTVHTINVFPAGKSRRAGAQGEPIGGPHTPVRGHFSLYGPKYGRGLLFGKHEGRFFVPAHVRGTKELGERQADYRLTPDREGL